MKLFIIIPDGVGVRNFLCSNFLTQLCSEGDVVVWHCLPEAFLAPFKERWGNRVRFMALPAFREGLVERTLRNSKLRAQLCWHNESGLDLILRRLSPRGRLPNQLVAYSSVLLARVSANAGGVQRLDRWHAKATLRSPYLARFLHVLAAERPDCVFCTHQRASRAVPAMLAARELGIPTATFIYSWDNLPKGRMAVHSDEFLVWSDTMRGEMLRYYPEVELERIHVVGTPQFGFYSDRSLLEHRNTFLRRLGLSPERPVLCFSGDDLTTSPFDSAYLRDVAVALRAFPEQERPQIVLRPCPTDNAERYHEVLQAFPEIVLSRPIWQSYGEDDWTQLVPTPQDVALLVNLATHCDAVVNVGSTMAVDFAICGNPAIYLAYNPPEAVGSSWNVEGIYGLPHFALIHSIDPVYWARSPLEIGVLIEHVLRNPQEKAQQRGELIRRMSVLPLAHASQRCCDALMHIAGKPITRCTSVS
jgi:hypothetical protein